MAYRLTEGGREREREGREIRPRPPDLNRADGRLAFYSRDIFAPLPVGLSVGQPRPVGGGRRRGVSQSVRAMLHRSPVGPEQNRQTGGAPQLRSLATLLRAECQAAKLSDFWVTHTASAGMEMIERRERIHLSRAQRKQRARHVCPPLSLVCTSMCALSNASRATALLFETACPLPPSPPPSLPPSRSAQRGFCHSGRSGSGPRERRRRRRRRSVRHHDQRCCRPTRERDTYKSRRLRPNRL